MSGIQLHQPNGVGIVNAAGAQHPAPVEIDVGQLCQLSFVGGSTQHYEWILSKPSESASVLSSGTSAGPSFIPDIDGGAYSISLFDDDEVEYILDIVTPTTGVGGGSGGGTSVTTTLDSYNSVRSASFASGSPPASVVVLGRADPNDGGQGTFIYVEGDTSADDDGTVLVDSDGHRFKRMYSGAIHAAWFGCRPTTVAENYDSLPAVEAAIAASSTSTYSGGRVLLPRTNAFGTPSTKLYFSDTLEINKTIILEGEGGEHVDGTWIRVAANKTGIHIATPATGGQFSVLRHFILEGSGSQVDIQPEGSMVGIYAEAQVRVLHCEIFGFPGHGIEIGGAGNCNKWSLYSVRVNHNGGWGVFPHGTEANAGCGTLVSVEENGLGGIFDSSFLGNVWTACHAAENGNRYPWPEDPENPLRVSYKGNSVATFVGCYEEDDNHREMGPGCTWVGWSDASLRRKHEEDTGMTLTPGQCRNITGVFTLDGVNYALQWGIGNNTRNTLNPEVMRFCRGRDDDSPLHSYRLMFYPSYNNVADRDAYYWAWAGVEVFSPLAFTAEGFGRGAGKALFPLGHFFRAQNTAAPKWRFVSNKPEKWLIDTTAFSGKEWQVGDSFDYTAPVSGGYKGRVCTRAGFYGDTWQQSTAYAVGNYVVPTVDNTYCYEVTASDGFSGVTEPTWPTSLNATVTLDGVTYKNIGAASEWEQYGLIGPAGTVTGDNPFSALVDLIAKLATAGVIVDGTDPALDSVITTVVQRNPPSFATLASWSIDSYGRAVCGVSTGDSAYYALELPNGCTLTSVTAYVKGNGNVALPAVMPQFIIRELELDTNTTSAGSAAVDASGSAGAYNVVHAITKSGLSTTINNTNKRYVVDFTTESGANAVTGFIIVAIVCGVTITGLDRQAS